MASSCEGVQSFLTSSLMTSQRAGSVSAGNVIPAIQDVSSHVRGDCCSIQVPMDLIFLSDTLTTPQEEPSVLIRVDVPECSSLLGNKL